MHGREAERRIAKVEMNVVPIACAGVPLFAEVGEDVVF